jgi:hypothetical protein
MARMLGLSRAWTISVTVVAVVAVVAVASAVVLRQAQATPQAAVVRIDPTHPCGNTPPRRRPAQYKVMVVVAENEQDKAVVDNIGNAPYQNHVGHQCGLQRNGLAVTHWSEANYLAMTSGTVPPWSLNDCLPSPTCSGDVPNLFGYLETAQRMWKSYAESMPGGCYQHNYPTNDKSAIYVPRHVPALYYTDLTASCGQHVVPFGDAQTRTGAFFTDLANGLPDLSFVTPNQINNTHNSKPRAFDDWLATVLPRVLDAPDYRAGRLVIFLTNDEGSGPDQVKGEDCTGAALLGHQPSCRIPAWVVGPWVPTGLRDETYYTHYAMLRTIQELLALTPDTGHPWLGHAADTGLVSLTHNFNLTPGQVGP